ncbi:hypothetical protein VSR68_03305 [Paraburkholderia phymatum]|uniref:hypothetical protein n=1 Tax=Paraburkholderia phymatum TaxID=148447 RepID=UPI0031748288
MCSVNWSLVLEYLKVFLSWPVVVGIGAIVGVVHFRDEFRSLVNRIASLEIGGAKLMTQQAVIDEATAGENAEAEPAIVEEPAPPALDALPIAPEEREQLQQAFEGERAAARMWEYRYLNYYFAPTTQAVLNWFVHMDQAPTFDAYTAFWMNRIPSAVEREAVLSALERHICIRINGEVLSVTEKGREYAIWPERRIVNITNDAYLNVVPILFS